MVLALFLLKPAQWLEGTISSNNGDSAEKKVENAHNAMEGEVDEEGRGSR